MIRIKDRILPGVIVRPHRHSVFEPCLVQIQRNLRLIILISSEIVWLEPQFCRQYCLPGQPITARQVWWPQFCPENGLSGRVWYCFQLCCRVSLVPNIRVLDRFKAKDLKIGSFVKIGFVRCFRCNASTVFHNSVSSNNPFSTQVWCNNRIHLELLQQQLLLSDYFL